MDRSLDKLLNEPLLPPIIWTDLLHNIKVGDIHFCNFGSSHVESNVNASPNLVNIVRSREKRIFIGRNS